MYSHRQWNGQTKCGICGSPPVSKIRMRFGLPAPEGEGVRCRLCANWCSIHESGSGYCGLMSQSTALYGVFITNR